MSVVPETIIQRAVISGFRQIRKDTRLLDVIFRNLHQDQLSAVKSFILETPIDFSVNYPRSDLKTPAIVLILKNEDESQGFLGDILGDSADPFTPDAEFSVDTLGGHAASVSSSGGLPRKVLGPLTVESQSGATLEFTEDATAFVEDLVKNPVGCLELYVVKGTGLGKKYNIARIRNNSLDIIGTFDPQLDSTSVVDIRVPFNPTEEIVGEPSRVYGYDSRNLLKLGSNFSATYHIHVLADKQEQVVYLYAVIKALLISQRKFLEAQGLQALKIGGSDFAPRVDMAPDEVFQRLLTVQFVYTFSFLQEQEVYDKLAIDVEYDGEVLVGTTINLD